jgi:hypothetical protein
MPTAIDKPLSKEVHIILVSEEPKTTVTVPNHDELDEGLYVQSSDK